MSVKVCAESDMAKTTPTQRSLAHLRKTYPLVAVVERWNPHVGIRQDLWTFIDIIAVGNGETVAVQTTSGSHVAERIKKITDAPALPYLREANWKIIVHGWTKAANGRYTLREVDLS
jgi:hypothetical protein